MECRCLDKKNYSLDIITLEAAAKMAQAVIDDQLKIDNSIDTLKTAYVESVNAPSNLATNFDDVHSGALANARIIKTQIDGALSTAKKKLREATEEDDEYHALN